MSGIYLLVAFDRRFDTAVVEFDSAWLPHVASGTKKKIIEIINGSGMWLPSAACAAFACWECQLLTSSCSHKSVLSKDGIYKQIRLREWPSRRVEFVAGNNVTVHPGRPAMVFSAQILYSASWYIHTCSRTAKRFCYRLIAKSCALP